MENERYYFEFIINSKNLKQKVALLKAINRKQRQLLHNFTRKILDEKIPLTKNQFQKLYQFRDFVRKLGERKVSISQLVKHISIIILILKVVYKKDEMGKQTCVSTNSRLGKDKKISSSEEYPKYCPSRTSSSDDDEFTNECFGRYSSAESGEEEEDINESEKEDIGE